MMVKHSTAAAVLVLVVSAIVASSMLLSVAAQQPTVTRKTLLQQDLPIPDYQGTQVAVEIPVGGREGRHTHPGAAVVHVLEGTMTFDYEGKPTATYKPGDSFFVEAGKIHEGINKGNAP